MDAAVVQSWIKGSAAARPESRTFQPGQVFQGTITELFKGSTARLQVGAQQLTAHLETSLEKGGRYWFQVQPGSGMPTLRVIEPPSRQQGAAPGDALAARFQLQGDKAAQQLIQQLSREGTPFTGRQLQEAAALMKESPLPAKAAVETANIMISREMPVTKSVFQALSTFQENRSLSAALSSIEAWASQNRSVPDAVRTAGLIQQMQNTSSPEQTGMLLKQLLAASSGGAVRTEASQFLQAAGLPSGAGAFSVVQERLQLPQFEQQRQLLLPDTGRAGVPQSPAALASQLQLQTPQRVDAFLSLFLPAGADKARALDMLTSLQNRPDASLENLHQALRQTSPSTFAAGQAVPAGLLKQLGFEHEAQMGRGQEMNGSNLKAALLSLLQNQSVTGETRRAAEFAVNRITGTQLLSQEQQGPVQQMLMQVPVELLQRSSDLTLQWMGRKKEDGTWDDSHCRILFYLEMDALKQTVIDLQIQNRVVTIHIQAESPKPPSMEEIWKPMLAEALEQKEYRLSSVLWKDESIQEKTGVQQIQPSSYSLERPHGYKGVDFRI